MTCGRHNAFGCPWQHDRHVVHYNSKIELIVEYDRSIQFLEIATSWSTTHHRLVRQISRFWLACCLSGGRRWERSVMTDDQIGWVILGLFSRTKKYINVVKYPSMPEQLSCVRYSFSMKKVCQQKNNPLQPHNHDQGSSASLLINSFQLHIGLDDILSLRPPPSQTKLATSANKNLNAPYTPVSTDNIIHLHSTHPWSDRTHTPWKYRDRHR